MLIIFFLLMILFSVQPSLAQEKPPTQTEMQVQIREAINQLNIQIIELEKQLADAKKNKEDEATIKSLEEQIANLKKQVAMMGGVKTNVSGISEKIIQQAGEKEAPVPKRDVERIKALPDKILSDSGLYTFIKKIHAGIEKIIPPEERTAALQIYLETKTNYKSVVEINNAATGCWVYGHWEKAVWLSGKVCLDSIADPDMLNNYASFLTMIGAEHAALPILQYLNKKYPKNSTVLNNIGQAWFGLGEVQVAKKFLDSVTMIFPDHSLANLTLSNIYLHQGDSVNGIAALRRSLKNYFTLEKAARIESLGAELDDDDIDFDYPMEDDPLGYEPFLTLMLPTPVSVTETPMAIKQWEAFHDATNLLYQRASEEANSAEARTTVFVNKMMDSSYNNPVLTLHNSNAYFKAGRKLPLAIKKKTAVSIEEVMNMMAEAFHQTTTNRLNALEKKRREDVANARGECAVVDAANNSFMQQAKVIIDEGGDAMNRVYFQNKKKVHNYIKLTAYSSLNDYNQRMGKFHEEIWKKNQWVYAYTANFAAAYRRIKKDPPMFSSCTPTNEEVPKQTKQLPSFKIPNCAYADSIKLIVGGIKEECNTCSIDESKLKFKKIEIEIGEVQISDASNSSAQGPQKQESVDPANTTSLGCNLSVPFKEGKGRPGKYKKCTVSSNRSSAGNHGSHITMVGSRLTLSR